MGRRKKKWHHGQGLVQENTLVFSHWARPQALWEIDIGVVLNGSWLARYLEAHLELSVPRTYLLSLATSTAPGKHACDSSGKPFWRGIHPLGEGRRW